MKKFKIEKRVKVELEKMRLDKLRGLNRITKSLYQQTGDEDYKVWNRQILSALMQRLGA